MKIKVLYISNMYPSKQKPYAGIFVKNQVEYIQKNHVSDISLEVYAMKRSFTSVIGSIYKYIKFWLFFTGYLFKKFDIIHVHYIFPNIILGYWYKFFHPNTKVVVTLHGEDITVQYPKYKSFISLFTPNIDLIIPVGNTLYELAKKHITFKKHIILPVGVNDQIFYKKINAQKKYDFIFVGSFIKRKGLDYLIDSLKKMRTKLKLVFIGSGELKESVQTINNHDITILENLNQQEIAQKLNESRYLILPSRNEGFPTVTMESFFCSTPVLGSSISQIKEQIQDGKNGYIFKLEDKIDLLNTIEYANKLDSLAYAALSDNAHKSFRNFSLSHVCETLVKNYHELV